jgi:uncharacterized protein with HEPN domain
MNRRDNVILAKIIRYCERIAGIISRFELDFDKFVNDYAMQMSISMGILQIGELANTLSDSFRSTHTQVPWRQIIDMRNKAAHAYDEFDFQVVWEVATSDIPVLCDNCRMFLNSVLHEESTK